MTNRECADILENLRVGISFINSVIPKAERDTIDIEALNYAIAVLRKGEEEND